MELRWMPERPYDWDQQIKKFPNKSFGHESAWLDYLGSAYPRNKIEYFEIRDAARVVGYFCMARVKKLSFSIYRSPLAGAGRHLGPLVEPHVDQGELVRDLVELCKSRGIAHLEISSDWLDECLIRSMGFRVLPNVVTCARSTAENPRYGRGCVVRVARVSAKRKTVGWSRRRRRIRGSSTCSTRNSLGCWSESSCPSPIH